MANLLSWEVSCAVFLSNMDPRIMVINNQTNIVAAMIMIETIIAHPKGSLKVIVITSPFIFSLIVPEITENKT